MFRFLRYKKLFHDFRVQFLLNPFRKCHYQTNPPSSLVQYLQTSLGFSAERALTLSQQLKGRKPKNPDFVLTFFKSHGFSEAHIKSIINRVPSFLFSGFPESALRSKIQFFKEKGISESVLVDLMVANPYFFTHSLEGRIKPVFNLLSSVLGTDEFAVQLLIRTKLKFNPHILSMNLTILRNCGVQNHQISKLFKRQPRALGTKSDRFNEVVERVKGMGFKPQMRLFVEAVFAIQGLSHQTWDAKFKVYSSLGLLDDEILLLFRRQPICMRLSEEKIRKGFVYLTKELGWDLSYILIYPNLLLYSLEKRIIPRHRFLQFLASNGFIQNDKILANCFMIGEKKFLKNFIMRYESMLPDILKVYKGLIESKLLNVRDGKDCNVC